MDGDGYNDFIGLAFGGSVHQIFALHRNNGDDTLAPIEYFPHFANSFGLRPLNFTHGDFNNDGHTDLLVIGYVLSSPENFLALGFYAGNGAGNFANPSKLTRLNHDLYLGDYIFNIEFKEITHGDFNGDGKRDIAITSTTDFLQVLTGNGLGDFVMGQKVKVGSQPIHVRSADFNNDGMLDLASANDGARTMQISLGKADGTFGDLNSPESERIVIPLDGDASFYDMVVSDFNLDGYPDIALADEASSTRGMSRGSIIVISGPGQ